MPNQPLPNLDYAFLAEFAKVDSSGSLTAIGASFTGMTLAELPATFPLAVAGRARLAEASDPVDLRLEFRGPTRKTPMLGLETQLAPAGQRVYEGRVGVLFTASTPVPLVEEGLHCLTIMLNGENVRELKFSVQRQPGSADQGR